MGTTVLVVRRDDPLRSAMGSLLQNTGNCVPRLRLLNSHGRSFATVCGNVVRLHWIAARILVKGRTHLVAERQLRVDFAQKLPIVKTRTLEYHFCDFLSSFILMWLTPTNHSSVHSALKQSPAQLRADLR